MSAVERWTVFHAPVDDDDGGRIEALSIEGPDLPTALADAIRAERIEWDPDAAEQLASVADADLIEQWVDDQHPDMQVVPGHHEARSLRALLTLARPTL
ncbi:hypothetical protein [Kitasatospora purpeofusca]|uniref:hypothetical protein n=1 Tax=Kitasatospora purpeofusca TaxID=67352 RepID=UPI00369FE26F